MHRWHNLKTGCTKRQTPCDLHQAMAEANRQQVSSDAESKTDSSKPPSPAGSKHPPTDAKSKSIYKCSILFGTFIHSFRIIICLNENYSK